MKRNIIFLTVLGIFLISLWSIPHSASLTLQGEDEDSHKREVQVEYESSQIRYQSELKNGSIKDVINVEVDVQSNYPDDNTSGQTEIKFKYKQESSVETQFEYRVELLNLVEYIENGTEWGFQSYEKISDYSVGGTGWHPVGYTFDNSSGSEIHIFNITTADDVVSIIIRVSSGIVNLGNATLTPNALKMDVVINDFPYSSGSSSLAFLAKVKTSVEVSQSNDTIEEGQGTGENEAELQLTSGDTTGYFSWAETAIIDGSVTSVITSLVMQNSTDPDLVEGEHSNDMYFSFNSTNPSHILWDPKLGVVTNDFKVPNTLPTSSSSTSTPVSSEPTSNTSVEESTVASSLPILNIYLVSSVFVTLGILVKRRR